MPPILFGCSPDVDRVGTGLALNPVRHRRENDTINRSTPNGETARLLMPSARSQFHVKPVLV